MICIISIAMHTIVASQVCQEKNSHFAFACSNDIWCFTYKEGAS